MIYPCAYLCICVSFVWYKCVGTCRDSVWYICLYVYVHDMYILMHMKWFMVYSHVCVLCMSVCIYVCGMCECVCWMYPLSCTASTYTHWAISPALLQVTLNVKFISETTVFFFFLSMAFIEIYLLRKYSILSSMGFHNEPWYCHEACILGNGDKQ